jgi:hypothetical protein
MHILVQYSLQYEHTRLERQLVCHKLTYRTQRQPSVDKIILAHWLHSSSTQNTHHVSQQPSLCEEIEIASSETYVTKQ